MAPQHGSFADRVEMQRRLFAEVSEMFSNEVPLYKKSLEVNRLCNRAAADLLARMYPGFELSDQHLDETSDERHGAIRIGTADEYRWVGRFFLAFAMEPHGFYDMTSLGAKSQPIIATAFRSPHQPEHRMFTSLLRTDCFDEATRTRIEARLEKRQVISDQVKLLIEKSEQEGGLNWEDACVLIGEASRRIFKWTGKGRDNGLYTDLCNAGFKIAADVACFETHHLNHLTPNTFCLDLYTAAMKFCLGEISEDAFKLGATSALEGLREAADKNFLRLLFRHLTWDEVESYEKVEEFNSGASGISQAVTQLVAGIAQSLTAPEFSFHKLHHMGFKDYTEGPPPGVPVLLRQDAYKALPEDVEFMDEDGTMLKTTHTARFGEIEQRFYATTPEGRKFYDSCLASATEAQSDALQLTKAFEFFPKMLDALLDQNLVYGFYVPTKVGLAARGSIVVSDIQALLSAGYLRREGQRYEDFLPFSAAGIFASNLKQYGTQCIAAEKPVFTQKTLEEVLGFPIVDPAVQSREAELQSQRDSFRQLGLILVTDESRKRRKCIEGGVVDSMVAGS